MKSGQFAVSLGLMNCFFFMSDVVTAHGMAVALGFTDANEAHRVLLPKLALRVSVRFFGNGVPQVRGR